MGPLEALDCRYRQELNLTLAWTHLGRPEAVPGRLDPSWLPEPDLKEPGAKTKDPHILCVRHAGKLTHLQCPTTWADGARKTREMVRLGVHPDDIIVATWIDGEEIKLRSAIEWLWWTSADQWELEAEIAYLGLIATVLAAGMALS